MGEIIGGTVIQRSFIGTENANIVHVATVPLSELGVDAETLEEAVAQVLGVPVTSILTDDGYDDLIEHLRSLPRRDLVPFLGSSVWDRYVERLDGSLTAGGSTLNFFTDFLSMISGASTGPAFFQLWPYLLEQEDFPVSSEALNVAVHCINSRVSHSATSRLFIEKVLEYEIPMGQSPRVASDSLLQLLESSRKFCVAPLALGGAQAVTQLTQGNYVAALMTTGTAGVMTLVLIGTVSVGALIVQKVAQARAKATSVEAEPPRPRASRKRASPN